MKAIIVCLSVCMCALHANAQSTNNTPVKVNTKPVKGYYSIYKNEAKLSAPVTATVKYQSTTPRKGYYAIGNNNSKLIKAANDARKKPAIKKGYYSIGNNKQKLK